MKKILLYGNGLNHMLNNNFVDGGSFFIKKNSKYNFSNNSYFHILQDVFKDNINLSLNEFTNILKEKNLEEFLTDINNGLFKNNPNIKNEIQIPNDFDGEAENEINHFIKNDIHDNIFIKKLLNLITKLWIKQCYKNSYEISNIFKSFEIGEQKKLEPIIDKLRKYSFYFTTNYIIDKFLEDTENKTLFINGTIDAFEEGILFDGMIDRFNTKNGILSRAPEFNVFRKYLNKSLNILGNFTEIRTSRENQVFNKENNFELDIIGWSPIQDERILESLWKEENLKKINFYLYVDETEENDKWNKKIVKIANSILKKEREIIISNEDYKSNASKIYEQNNFEYNHKQINTNFKYNQENYGYQFNNSPITFYKGNKLFYKIKNNIEIEYKNIDTF